MRSISSTQRNTILSMLDAGQSAHSIASATGLHSELQKAAGGHPSKLSFASMHYAIYLISSRKTENAIQVIKAVTNVVSQFLP